MLVCVFFIVFYMSCFIIGMRLVLLLVCVLSYCCYMSHLVGTCLVLLLACVLSNFWHMSCLIIDTCLVLLLVLVLSYCRYIYCLIVGICFVLLLVHIYLIVDTCPVCFLLVNKCLFDHFHLITHVNVKKM